MPGLSLRTCEAIRDLCSVVADNPVTFARFRTAAQRLEERLDGTIPLVAARIGETIVLTADQIELAVDIAAAVADALVKGTRLSGSLVLMRVCERVIVPITDALGFREEPGGDQ